MSNTDAGSPESGNGEEIIDEGALPLDEHARPPDDAPDGGTRTAMEEVEAAQAEDQEEPPKKDSHLDAGYPLLKDEDLPSEPGTPIVEVGKPDPKSMRGAPLFSAAAYLMPGLTSPEADPDAADQIEEQLAKMEMVEYFITDDRLDDLWARGNNAADELAEAIPSPNVAGQMLDQIKYSRNEIMGGRDRYEESERYLNEVEYRLALVEIVRKWSTKYGPFLFLYEFVWGVGLMLILFLYLGDNAFASANSPGVFETTYLVGSMVWGGFGGVVSALYALMLHIALRQDFDKQHLLWYFYSPLMGLGVGAVVYLFMRVGLLSLMGSDGAISSPIIIYVIAWLAGYQHNVFSDLVKRLLKVFKVEEAKEKEESTLPKPPAPSPSQDTAPPEKTGAGEN